MRKGLRGTGTSPREVRDARQAVADANRIAAKRRQDLATFGTHYARFPITEEEILTKAREFFADSEDDQQTAVTLWKQACEAMEATACDVLAVPEVSGDR